MANAVKASPFALSKKYFLQHKNRRLNFAISESNVKCKLQNIDLEIEMGKIPMILLFFGVEILTFRLPHLH
ncbi:MAG TPA: hypothetical protein VF941_03955 [Clostridia bacterium]